MFLSPLFKQHVDPKNGSDHPVEALFQLAIALEGPNGTFSYYLGRCAGFSRMLAKGGHGRLCVYLVMS
jgi:hypothetical protein